MASFHALLQQLVDAHEADLAQLQEKVEELQEELALLHCSECHQDVEVSSPSRHWALEGQHHAPPTLMGEEGFEPVIKIFGMEVQHLGLRVQWNAERPIVQRVVQGTAAEEGGVRPGDVLMAINGAETLGRPREELLAFLQQRPLTLELLQKSHGGFQGSVHFGTPQASLYHLQSSFSNLGQPQSPSALPMRRSKVTLEAVKEESAKKKFAAKAMFQSEEEEKVPRNVSKMTLNNSPRDAKRGVEKSSEGLGLKRFITARKESTANVAHLGIGNFRMTFYEDQKTRRLSLNHLFHMMVKWLTHLQEPERSGFAYNFLESRFFNSLCSTIILMHAVVVTLASDWEVNNLEGAVPESYQTLELVFLGFYAAELALRLYVHRCFFFFGEAAGWNWFDFCLVVFSFMDIIYLTMQMTATEATGANVAFMRLFRLFKITKILRTIRIIKVFRELSMMVESFTKCIVAMFWGLVLLVFLLYIFALVFVSGITDLLQDHRRGEKLLDEQQLEDVKSQFGSVLESMLSLYMAVTGGNDWSMYFDTVSMCGVFYTVLFLLFNFFFVFALFNIMTGVFVERALTAAIPDRDELIWEEQKKLAKQVEDFKELCKEFDTDGSGMITREEFRNHMRNDSMVSYMASVGLEMHDVEKQKFMEEKQKFVARVGSCRLDEVKDDFSNLEAVAIKYGWDDVYQHKQVHAQISAPAAPPPDLRQLYWIESSKSGDHWLFYKDGGPPKFIAPANVPFTKIYRNGKFMLQGPGPEPFALEELYKNPECYDAWVGSLEGVGTVTRGPKLHSTPDDLSELDGPGFKLHLNKNDHRWTATFKKVDSPSIFWIDAYKQNSMSRSFVATSEADWIAKLKAVHAWAWGKWSVAEDIPHLKLPSGACAQEPGEVSASLIAKLRPIIETLPEKTVYGASKK